MLARLTVDNFRSHGHTELDFDRQIVYVAGGNGVGKSSLRMALQMIFTNTCPVTDKRGSGRQSLIRQGANDYGLVAELRDGQRIERHTGSAVGLGAAKIEGVREAVESKLAPIPVMETVLGGSYFELDAATQRNLLVAMSGAEMDTKEFRIYAKEAFGEVIESADNWHKDTGHSYDGDPEVGLREASGHLASIEADSVAALDAAAKLFSELRTGSNRTLKGAAVQMEAMPSEVVTPEFKVDDVKARMKELAAEVAKGKAAAPTTSQEESKRLLEALKGKQRTMQEELDKMDVPKNLEDTLRKAVKREQDADEIIRSCEKAMATIDGSLNMLKSELGKRTGLGSECPTCHQSITEERRGELEKEVKDRIDELGTKRKAAEEKAAKARDQKARAATRVKELRYIQEFIPTLEETGNRIKQMEKALEKDAGDAQAKAEQALEDKRSMLAELTEKYGHIIEEHEKYRLLAQQHADAKNKTAAYEFMLALIRQYKNSKVDQKLGAFLEGVNKHAAVFGLEFTVDPAELLVTTSKGIDYRNLSESEQVRTDTIFRLALALSTGLRMIVVDRVDVLDAPGRKGLLKVLLDAGVSALLLAKVDGELVPPPLSEKIAWYQIKLVDGVSVLEEKIPA